MTKPPFLALSCIGFLASAPAFAADPVAATPKTGVAADPQAQDARRRRVAEQDAAHGKSNRTSTAAEAITARSCPSSSGTSNPPFTTFTVTTP